MGASISSDEFMDIILSSLPPSYDVVINALTTSLEECGRAMNPDSIIRVLKAQYDKHKTLSTSIEDQVFFSTSKKVVVCTNCKKKGHIKENCWAKGGRKEGQGPHQKKESKSKKKKGKAKANIANESLSDEPDEPIAFMNFNCTTLIKDSTGTTQILDTGASSHRTPHRNLLANYSEFAKPRKIRAANKGTFEALGISPLIMPTKIHGKETKIMLRDTLYAPDIAFTVISIGKCDDAGYQTMFAQQKCIVKDAKGNTLLEAPKFHGLYHLDCDNEEITPLSDLACS